MLVGLAIAVNDLPCALKVVSMITSIMVKVLHAKILAKRMIPVDSYYCKRSEDGLPGKQDKNAETDNIVGIDDHGSTKYKPESLFSCFARLCHRAGSALVELPVRVWK